MSEVTLVLGGARSGKSTFAQDMAEKLSGAVLYVAPAIAFDDDMKRRIAAHRASRPANWRTLESPAALAVPISEGLVEEKIVLIDCLTLWVSNMLMGDPQFPFEGGADTAALQDRVIEESRAVLAQAREKDLTLIAVSNEVGMGVVPPFPSGHVFRDLLGRVNQAWAAGADRVYLMVAGIPLTIKGG